MVSRKEYNKIVERNSPKSKTLLNCARAFVFGGAFCALGQGIMEIISLWGVKEQDARTLTSVALIFLGVLLTLLGVYDKIAKHAGAGTLVPITGFANAVSAPAIEFKTEGFITGTAAKMFVIAGPVIVYGTGASIVYGLLLCLFGAA